jgi:hypothetical protein
VSWSLARGLRTSWLRCHPGPCAAAGSRSVGQNVAPVASGLEKMELDRALAEMEGTYGASKARELARQVMPMLRNNPYFSTPEGIRQAFHAAYGQQAIQQNQRAARAPGMETVDASSRQRQQAKTYASALENWLVTPRTSRPVLRGQGWLLPSGVSSAPHAARNTHRD